MRLRLLIEPDGKVICPECGWALWTERLRPAFILATHRPDNPKCMLSGKNFKVPYGELIDVEEM